MPDGASLGPSTLRVEGLVRRFGAVAALDGVSFSVRPGEVLGVIGRSGAGKSTLIRCLNGLERPDAGVVAVEGQDIARLREHDLVPVRRRVGMIFQHFNLMSARTVAGNVALPLKIARLPRRARDARVAELLDMVGLADKAHAYPAQLSGGQKQRVGIARALATRPALLLCVEATSALDPETTDAVLELLREINRTLNLTIVLITHEMSVVRAIADRVIVLEAGRVVEAGPVPEVFAAPRDPVTRRLLAGLGTLPRAAAGHGMSVLRVRAHGDAVGDVLADLTRAGVRASFLSGGLDAGQRAKATVYLGVTDSASEWARTVLRERAHVEEVSHVAGPG